MSYIRELYGLVKQSWVKTHNPGANTQAIASQPAGGANIRHVCTSVSATFSAGGTAPTAVVVTLNLRDGASGAGTVLWSQTMSLPATAGAGSAPIQMSGLNIMGSANTAMTLEFSAAGGANTLEAVAITGFDIADV